jgi:hypothetical protein
MQKTIEGTRALSNDELASVSGAAAQALAAAAALWFAGFAVAKSIDSLLDSYESGNEVKGGKLYIGGRKFG